ncbi:hypothetical protein O9993_17510 [Vibrio lentus]|nr:hypothetical protein [Vibrio lentus]
MPWHVTPRGNSHSQVLIEPAASRTTTDCGTLLTVMVWLKNIRLALFEPFYVGDKARVAPASRAAMV